MGGSRTVGDRFVGEEQARDIAEELKLIGEKGFTFDGRKLSELSRPALSREAIELGEKGLTEKEKQNFERQLQEIQLGVKGAESRISQSAREQAKIRGFTGSEQDIVSQARLQAGVPSFEAAQRAKVLGREGAARRQGILSGSQLRERELLRQAGIQELLQNISLQQAGLTRSAFSKAGSIFGATPKELGPGSGQALGAIGGGLIGAYFGGPTGASFGSQIGGQFNI